MKRKHLGSSFEDFLAEEGLLVECRGNAVRFATARVAEKKSVRRGNSLQRGSKVSYNREGVR